MLYNYCRVNVTAKVCFRVICFLRTLLLPVFSLSFSAIQHPVVSVLSSSGVNVWKCAVSQCVCVSVLYDQISNLW